MLYDLDPVPFEMIRGEQNEVRHSKSYTSKITFVRVFNNRIINIFLRTEFLIA